MRGADLEQEQFFEDYVVGAVRQTLGRTITEADIVFHAGHSGDFFPHAGVDESWRLDCASTGWICCDRQHVQYTDGGAGE